MIEQTDLMKLLESYKIDYKKVMTDKVLDKGEYFGIKHVLEYLVNELKINPKNIEKCPSILYLNVNEVRKNYEFLKQEKINEEETEKFVCPECGNESIIPTGGCGICKRRGQLVSESLYRQARRHQRR